MEMITMTTMVTPVATMPIITTAMQTSNSLIPTPMPQMPVMVAQLIKLVQTPVTAAVQEAH
jgi:hypothetical protein